MAQMIEIYLSTAKIDQDQKDEKGNYKFVIAVGEEEDNYGNNVKVWHKCEKHEVKKYVANGRTFWSNKGEFVPARKTKNDTQAQTSNASKIDKELPF